MDRRTLLLGAAALLLPKAAPSAPAEWKDVLDSFDPWADVNEPGNACCCCWASDIIQKVPEYGDLFYSSARTANEKRHQDGVLRQLLDAGFDGAQFAAVRRRGQDRLTDTQCFVAWDPDMVLVCFRGTQWKAEDILTDARILQSSVRDWHGARVHSGWLAGLEAVWPSVSSIVERNVRREDGRPKRLWVTGHSLGGALAVLAARRFSDTRLGNAGVVPVQGVYVFGCPRVGDHAFAQAYNRLPVGARTYAYVYGDDLVARLPPNLPVFQWHAVGVPCYVQPGGRLVQREASIKDYAPEVRRALMGLWSGPVPRRPLSIAGIGTLDLGALMKLLPRPREFNRLAGEMDLPVRHHNMYFYRRATYQLLPAEDRMVWPAPTNTPPDSPLTTLRAELAQWWRSLR